MGKWLRLHLDGESHVDVKANDEDPLTERSLSYLLRAESIYGTNPDGNPCAVRREKIVWVEVIEKEEDLEV